MTDFTATLPRKRMASAVLFTDADGRVLLVEPVYKDHWEIVGGCVEAGESPRQAATREVAEELGKTFVPGRLLVVDWVPPRPARTEGVIFVYDGGRLDRHDTAGIRLPQQELRAWAWCTKTEIAERLPELLSRRVNEALRARAEGTTLDLENGVHVR